MRILIASISKLKKQDYSSMLINEYLNRMKTWKIEFINKPNMDLKEQESRALLDTAGSKYLIALDPKGEEMSSEQLSAFFSKLQVQGSTDIIFAIGGAYGHDDLLLKKSHKVLSLSKMTFAHKIAKIVLVEQIYRAYTLLLNHPYHK